MDTIPPRHCRACGEAIWHRHPYWEMHQWPRLEPTTYCVDCVTYVVFVEPIRRRRLSTGAGARPKKVPANARWPSGVKAERSEP